MQCNYLEFVWKITENLIQNCLKTEVKLCQYDITLRIIREEPTPSNLMVHMENKMFS